MKLIFNSEEINDIFAIGIKGLGLTNIDKESMVVEIKQTRGEGGDTYASVECNKKVIEDNECTVRRELDMHGSACRAFKPSNDGDDIQTEQEVDTTLKDAIEFGSDSSEAISVKPESDQPLSSIFNK